MVQPYTFGFLDQLVRINFPQNPGNFLIFGEIFNQGVLVKSLHGTDFEFTTDPSAPGRAGPLSAAFGNRIWLAAAVNGAGFRTLYKSTDKTKSWTEIPVPFFPISVAFGKGKFVVLGGNDNDIFSVLVSSDDGKTWVSGTLPVSAQFNAHSVAFVKDAFFVLSQNANRSDAFGGDPNCYLSRSTDGLSWGSIVMFQNIPIISEPEGEDVTAYGARTVTGIAYDSTSKSYMVVGGAVKGPTIFTDLQLATSLSSDGVTWDGGVKSSDYKTEIGFAPSASWVAAGAGVFVTTGLTSDGFNTTLHILTGVDGVSWEDFQPFSAEQISTDGPSPCCLYSPTEKAFIVGFAREAPSSGNLFTWRMFRSEDGFNWQEQDVSDINDTAHENFIGGGAIGDLKSTTTS